MHIPFQKIDWSLVEKIVHSGGSGTAIWQTVQRGGLRIRIVEYSAGYLADHWCGKGHIVHCLEGSFISELKSGEIIKLEKGDSYVVSDGMSEHRSISEAGARLLIIDGEFLSGPDPDASNP